MKILIAYYSFGGNTKQIAGLLKKQLNADVTEIRTATPYAGSYDDVVAQGQREVEQGYEPELCPMELEPRDYDVIILGTPVWWYTFAPAVKTFLARSGLDGKRVYPFMTNGGWPGHTEKDIAAACPTAKVEKGIDIRFDGDHLVTPAAVIQQWAEQIG